jgi:membrane-associated phospholipid phosphatase
MDVVRKLYIITLLTIVSSTSFAQNKSPYEVRPEYEIPIALGLFTVSGVPRLFADEMPGPSCGLECDPNNVNGFDRNVIGYHSGTAATLSDVAFFSSMLLPHAAGALDVGISNPEDGWEGYGKDTLVLVETMLFALAVNNILDISVRRARPLAYDAENFSEEERLDPNTAFSFPSGHTAVVFALGTAYSRLYMQRHPDSPYIAPIWIGSYALGVGAGLGRVFAGEHFWTDVLAGMGLGIGSGLLVPLLHETGDNPNMPKITPLVLDRGAGLTISVSN